MSTGVSDVTTQQIEAQPTRTKPALPPRSRAPRAVRANRIVIGLVGLILLLAGAAGLLAGFGIFGSTLENEAVLSARVDRYVDSHGWFWPVLAAFTAVIALLAVVWLIAQVRTNRLRGINVASGRDGHTYLQGGAVTEALETEVESYRGVSKARVRLSGTRSAPRLTLVVTLDGRVGAGEIRHRVEGQALDHARHALDTDWLPARVDLVLPRASQRNLH